MCYMFYTTYIRAQQHSLQTLTRGLARERYVFQIIAPLFWRHATTPHKHIQTMYTAKANTKSKSPFKPTHSNTQIQAYTIYVLFVQACTSGCLSGHHSARAIGSALWRVIRVPPIRLLCHAQRSRRRSTAKSRGGERTLFCGFEEARSTRASS